MLKKRSKKLPLTHKIKTQKNRKLKPVWKIGTEAASLVWDNRKLFSGIALTYAVISFIFVHTLNNSLFINKLQEVRDSAGDSVYGGFLTMTWLINNNATAGQTARMYDFIFILLTSLAVLYALRHIISGQKNISVRESFYRSTGQIVPVLIVIVLLLATILPGVIGTAIYSVIVSNLARTTMWQLLCLPILIVPLIYSFYLFMSFIFAPYIATLPDMTPVRALRTSWQLSRGRWFSMVRKIVVLLLTFGFINAIIVIPFILEFTVISPYILFVVSVAMLPLAHACMYGLYRELIDA